MSGTTAAEAVEQRWLGEVESLRGTARWMVGTAGTAFAVLLVGVPFSTVGTLVDYPTRLGVALGAGAVTLLAVGWVLALAVRVLVDARADLADPVPGWLDEQLQERLAELGRDRATLEPARLGAVLTLLVVRRRFRHLTRWMAGLAVVPVLGVVVFTSAATAPPEAAVTAPTPVVVELRDDARSQGAREDAGIRDPCVGRRLGAVAVAGTFNQPIVVRPGPDCPLPRVEVTRALGVAYPLTGPPQG